MLDLTEQEVRVVVGKRADYYLAKWGPRLAGGEVDGGTAGFNWAAFLLTAFWLPYRKMRRAATIFFGVTLLATLVEGVLVWLGGVELPDGLSFGITAAIGFVCGMWGNRWYLGHVRRIVAEVRALALPEEEHLWMLERRGGTSVAMAIAFFAVAALVFAFALYLLELVVFALAGGFA